MLLRHTATLALTAIIGATSMLIEDRSASACSPPASPAHLGDDQISVDIVGSNIVPGQRIPPEGGVVFMITTGAKVAEDDVRARLHIRVTRDGAELEGRLSKTTRHYWLWKPNRQPLALGPLDVTFGVDSAPSPQSKRTVTVIDQEFPVPKVDVSLVVHRFLTPAPDSPKIVCAPDLGGGSCGGPHEIPTRLAGVPMLEFSAPAMANNQPPELVDTYVTLFSRNAKGESTVAPEIFGYTGSGIYSLDHADDEYCVAVTMTSMLDGSRTERSESCVPGRDVDLSVSNADEEEAVRQSLRSCSQPSYPPGYAEAHPNVTGAGCNCGVPGRARDDGYLAAITTLGCALISRRTRRRSLRL